jgi:hypothetical protein
LEIKNFILDFFTPREWATFTLIGALILFSTKSKDVRNSILRFIKTFFHWKIIIPIICAQLYLFLFYYILYKLNIWNDSILREVMFFSLFTSISLIFKYSGNNDRISSLKGIIEDTVTASIIIEFYLQIYTFSYPIELLIQFLLAFFYLMGVYNKRETKDYERTYTVTQSIFYCLTVFLLVYSIYTAIKHWENNFSSQTVASLLFPIIATIAYWPFLYVFATICAYETWFVRIFFASKKDKDVYRFRKRQVIKTCKLNLRKINFISKDFHVYIPQTREEFIHDLQMSEDRYYNQNND